MSTSEARVEASNRRVSRSWSRHGADGQLCKTAIVENQLTAIELAGDCSPISTYTSERSVGAALLERGMASYRMSRRRGGWWAPGTHTAESVGEVELTLYYDEFQMGIPRKYENLEQYLWG